MKRKTLDITFAIVEKINVLIQFFYSVKLIKQVNNG